MKKVEREGLKQSLQKLDDSQARVLVATGKLVGEGFDYPVLDTLFLALPFAWRGTLTQYVGRIVREYSGKNVVRIYDVLDEDCPVLMSMWNRRRKGYATNGIAPMAEDDLLKNV